MNLDNPFKDELVAKQWINSVEGEKGMTRDNESYPYLQAWFNSTSKGTIVDIGSGQGVCSSKIEGYSKYIGIEPSTFLTDRAKELYKSPSREFVVGDAFRLPLENESCDNAISFNVWFHLEDLDKASHELSRVLKSGGKFWIHTADNDALEIWKSFYVNPIIDNKKILGEVRVPVNNMSINTFFLHTNQQIVDSLQKVGLKVLKTTKLGTIDKGTLFVVFEGEKI